MENLILKIVNNYAAGKDSSESVSRLYGDASYRSYFRVIMSSGRSYIVMKLPDGISSASEEITNYTGPKTELPFINVANYLREIGVRVPEVVHFDSDNRAVILEDAGDTLLFDLVKNGGAQRELSYKKAIDLLVELQQKTLRSSNSIAFERSFDAELLNWELDHFVEYGINARIGHELREKDEEKFARYSRAITEEITSMPYIFVHRDFQSRNLMVQGDEIILLDFQDALRGPRAYDLVALLRDSYVVLSDKDLSSLIEYYCERTNIDPAVFRIEFDLVTVQRKLKDAGRFVYIDRVKKNPNYLQYIPASLAYVKSALSRLDKYEKFAEALKPYIPEWNNG